MASIESYKTANGEKRYQVRYRKPDHSSTRKRGFKTKAQAEAFKNEQMVAIKSGQFIDESMANTTVTALVIPWLESKKGILKPSAYKSLESSWRNQVQSLWGNRRISSIRHSEVQSWVSAMSAKYSATSVIRAYGILSAVLDVAVRDRRILSNDAKGVDLPRKIVKRRPYLTMQQVEVLAVNCNEHATLILTMAYTGLRWGEVTALTLSDFDALRKRLAVNQNAVDVSGTIVVGTPKNHTIRSVGVPEFLVELIAKECKGKSQNGLIFGDGINHVRRPTSGRGWFESAVTKCRMGDDTFPRITPHDLRHTAASLAISKTSNPKIVQRMLGHKSAAMTLDTYADLFEDDLDSVADQLNIARLEQNVSILSPNAVLPMQKTP